ncbi:MAG: lipase family protein [Pseudomonadota bacterium]|uniref:lipase family protein n=1 Tax=Gallaecimonas pentaromativorans TaxID=584787 RepID=UPI00067EF0DA|nr:lipase family protein [Gallaecimonas pentaromativorans]MED5525953.1 lipase family protein [Pseudomonadota bacterium]
MPSVTPRVASQLALLTYDIESADRYGNYRFTVPPETARAFEIDANPVLGQSGFALLRKKLGFCLVGKGIGAYEGDHVIALRGTNPGNIVDVLTDLNIGVTTAENGSLAHYGFVHTFDSFKATLKSYLDKNPGRGTIHCIGHSLGGALATLTADWAKKEYRRTVKLYTFGCPRVGYSGFARNVTANIDKIYRCTHGADPITKVPLWPFYHTPYQGSEFRLDGSTGFRGAAHKMAADGVPGYLNTANKSDWDSVKIEADNFLSRPVQLNYENRYRAFCSGTWSDKISAFLLQILKAAGVTFQFALTSGFSIYDFLAQRLEDIAKLSAKFAKDVKALLGHMLAFAGRFVDITIEFTSKFIRWVFDIMLKSLGRLVKQALK